MVENSSFRRTLRLFIISRNVRGSKKSPVILFSFLCYQVARPELEEKVCHGRTTHLISQMTGTRECFFSSRWCAPVVCKARIWKASQCVSSYNVFFLSVDLRLFSGFGTISQQNIHALAKPELET
ncbi:hypothetical protein CEXT_372071 [Caerostris extrusa]|uniref:Uncharacterized protein n=1 Tax=Caerostris extrusa TaxID=172846 RepID=A0AAV4Q013_CAEEX|nr:hypothetical protein CEXT_372071 [Caerostris extrusa]